MSSIIPKNIGPLHFVGIGGIGMSGIAEVLCDLNYKVQGSDISDNANVQRLRKKGMDIKIGHDAAHVQDGLSAVVISSAVKCNNPEVIAAREKGIPVVRRADMLAELMRLKRSIAIGGTHGKTTTTSLVGTMLEVADFDPTVVNGGIINKYGTNTRLGHGEWMVVESDESDGSFTRLPASIVVVTNIDPEHMDHYGDFDALRAAFRQFVENIPFYGYAVLCTDHPEVQALHAKIIDRKIISYGFNPQAEVRGVNVRMSPLGATFDVVIDPRINSGDEKVLRDVFLPMIGRHNVQNALSAIAIAHRQRIPEAVMRKALSDFEGVKRRFTKTGIVNGITIVDDYGHHPVEIAAVLASARAAVEESGGKIHAVMQPHRFTRLRDLFADFCACFNDADSVLVADVYAASEEALPGITKESLVSGIKQYGHKNADVLQTPGDLADIMSQRARAGDFIIFLGAGDITKWAYALPDALQQRTKPSSKTIFL
ncbi:MAG: UDP-N-acetylmuramate--L-alanine ligase [Rhodospirillales bacterium]|nr:UDP-N-acetylmuramate--L-alanine ligase [Rhodospirillales bacterium]